MPAKNQRQAPNWLRQRSIGRCQKGEAQVSIDSMRRLQLETTLEGHSACVNCLEWNWSGNLLASGSDDQNVIIWDPFKGVKRNLIQTGHKGTIFSVKFVPDFCDNLIASGAADGSVKVINVLANETILNCTSCHLDRVKRLTVHPNEPHLVWSAGEDSFIMQYDIREPHSCKSSGNKNLLLDLRTEGVNAAAKCLAINPMRDEMLAVGANDVHVRLFDRRMMRQRKWDSCTAYFTPGHLLKPDNKTARQSFGTTYLAFSPDGSELLANMHAEQIHLFNTYEPWECYKSFEATVKPLILEQPTPLGDNCHSNCRSSSSSFLSQQKSPYAPWRELRKQSVCIDLPKEFCEFYTEMVEKIQSKKKLTKEELDKINELLIELRNCADLYRLRASALILRSWSGDHYQAIRDCCCALALKPLDYQTLENLALATCHLGDRDSASGLLEIVKMIQSDYGGIQVASRTLSDWLHGNLRDSTASSWIADLQYYQQRYEEQSVSPMSISPNQMNFTFHASSDHSSPQKYAQPQSVVDEEMHPIFKLINRTEYDLQNMGAFDYTKRYCGHCNMNTDIKEANFFGYDGEFIVAGSDDGAFYIWDKETTNIVKAVHGDLHILNCLQPHPSICMLATSGIEPSVKLWSPSGKICHDVRSLEDRCAQNQDYITSDPLEAMIMLLYPPDQYNRIN